jgi:hypothetical protein
MLQRPNAWYDDKVHTRQSVSEKSVQTITELFLTILPFLIVAGDIGCAAIQV